MSAEHAAASSEPALLEVRDVATYLPSERGLVRAVDGVSLRVDAGRFVGVVGESGSGKSMLLRSIIDILPRSARKPRGEVLFRGSDVRAMSKRELQAIWGPGIGIVFQDPNTSLNPVRRIDRQIVDGPRTHRLLANRDARGLVLELLREVGIPDPERRARAYPHELSGGMRQRVAIAVALACDPALLLADEITSALDVTVQAQILELLRREQERRGMGIVFVTHNLGVVAQHADLIAVMYAGRIVEHADARTMISAPRHPYTEALLACIPRLDQPTGTTLLPIPGQPPNLVGQRIGCAFAPRCARVQPRCLNEDPRLEMDEPGRSCACFYPVGTDRGTEALARNARLGRMATGVASGSPVGPPATGVRA